MMKLCWENGGQGYAGKGLDAVGGVDGGTANILGEQQSSVMGIMQYTMRALGADATVRSSRGIGLVRSRRGIGMVKSSGAQV